MWGILLLIASQSLAEAGATNLEPIHLRPGSLVGHVGEVELVTDSLWVEYPYQRLLSVPQGLLEAVEALNDTVVRYQQSRQAGDGNGVQRSSAWWSSRSLEALPFLDARIAFIRDSLMEVLGNYRETPASVVPSHPRTKRGLLDVVGHLSRTLFGTALDKDVQDVKLKNRALEGLVRVNAKSIKLANAKIDHIVSRVTQLTNFTNRIANMVNGVAEVVDWAVVAINLDQQLTLLESVTNNIVQNNKIILANLVDAARGRVTSSLLPVSDLRKALHLGRADYSLIPVFDESLIQHYYPLLDSFVAENSIVLHIPFKSSLVFDAFYMEPFPFEAGNATYVLDGERQYVLVQKDLTHYATVQPRSLEGCRTEFQNHYFCPSALFAFFPITDNVCEVSLTRPDSDHSLALKVCPFSKYVPDKPCHANLFGFHYLYLPQEMYVSVVCPGSSQGKRLSGHLATRVECSIRTSNLKTYPETVHAGFWSEKSPVVYELSSLTNLTANLPQVKERLPLVDIPHLSILDDNVTDADLPFYLEPSFHYSTFFIPVIVIIIALIPITVGLRRALRLYVMLKTRVSSSTSRGGSPQEVGDPSV